MSNYSGRTGKSMINIIFGIANQALILALGFISRTIFINILTESYLGINVLFAEILSMLSLADLGLGSVMVYSFFEPLAHNDMDRLKSLLNFYRRIYYCIAATIVIFGIALIPVLPHIVKIDKKIDLIYVYYILFLLKTVCSYLFVYKVSILNADQNNYIVSKISMRTNLLTIAIQIVVLVITKNYLLYLITDVTFTLVNNYWCSRKVDELYPELSKVRTDNNSLDDEKKKDIWKTIRAGFLYKLSGMLLNSTDNTIISTIIGTVWVGYLSNYSIITTQIARTIGIIFSSMTGSIGNLIQTEQKEKRYQIFKIMQTGSILLGGISITCIFILINDFIKLWIGTKFILNNGILICLLMNLYFSTALQPLWSFRNATGIFKKTKYMMLLCSIINIVISVLLCRKWGIAGVLVGSVIARGSTYFWYEPIILFREFFGKRPIVYFENHIFGVLMICIVTFILQKIAGSIQISTWLGFIEKGFFVAFLSLISYLLLCCRTSGFIEGIRFIKSKKEKQYKIKKIQ